MSVPKMTGKEFVNLICKTLGINDLGVYGVRITADLRSAVNVEIQTRLSTDDARTIVKHLESFTVDPTAFEKGLAVANEKAKAFTPVKLAPKKLELWPTADDGTALVMTPCLEAAAWEAGGDVTIGISLEENDPQPEIVEKPR